MTPLPGVTVADALDDGDWFGANPKRRYRVRPSRAGTWIVRRRGRVFLRTFTAALPPGLPDTDDALRRPWFAAAWPDLDPRIRAELTKAAHTAEQASPVRRPKTPGKAR